MFKQHGDLELISKKKNDKASFLQSSAEIIFGQISCTCVRASINIENRNVFRFVSFLYDTGEGRWGWDGGQIRQFVKET